MSALDGRIRHLAREEATALLGVGTAVPNDDGTDRVTELEKQLAELRSELDRTVKRLLIIETSRTPDQEAKGATRRGRRTAESSE